MKYIKKLLIFFLLIIITGCSGTSNKVINNTNKKNTNNNISTNDKINNNDSHNNNNIDIPISFYKLNNNTLSKVNEISDNFNPLDDIFLLQIYPSNDDTVNLDERFPISFFNTYNSYNKNNNLKIGFEIEYYVDDNLNRLNIFTPDDTMKNWEYFMAYLYDDYINMNNSFYSHIESNEYNDNTLFTSIKLQCGAYCKNIIKTVNVSVFIYTDENDFKDGKYQGNSKSTISICLNNNC